MESLITAAARALDPIQRCRFANRLEVRERWVRSYRGSRTNIDGGTRYLAGVVDRYAHPNQ